MLFWTGVPVNKNRLLVWIRRSMAISWHLGFFNRWPSSTTNNGHCSRLKKALPKGNKRRSEHEDRSITFHWWWCDRQWSARRLRICSSVDVDSVDDEVQRVSPWGHDRRYRWSKEECVMVDEEKKKLELHPVRIERILYTNWSRSRGAQRPEMGLMLHLAPDCRWMQSPEQSSRAPSHRLECRLNPLHATFVAIPIQLVDLRRRRHFSFEEMVTTVFYKVSTIPRNVSAAECEYLSWSFRSISSVVQFVSYRLQPLMVRPSRSSSSSDVQRWTVSLCCSDDRRISGIVREEPTVSNRRCHTWHDVRHRWFSRTNPKSWRRTRFEVLPLTLWLSGRTEPIRSLITRLSAVFSSCSICWSTWVGSSSSSWSLIERRIVLVVSWESVLFSRFFADSSDISDKDGCFASNKNHQW